MTRNFKTLAFALLALATLLAFTPTAQAAPCSLGSVAGAFGYHANGFVSPAAGAFIPAASAGETRFDGHGGVTGKQTRVVAGVSLEETYTGTYTVNPDCSGSFTVLVQPDTRTSSVSVVWTNNTNNASFVFTTPAFTITGFATRISTRR